MLRYYPYAQAMHEGALKYAPNNWLKGLPIDNLLNHALAHLVQFVMNDSSEPHASHLVWNIMAIIYFERRKAWPCRRNKEKEDAVKFTLIQ